MLYNSTILRIDTATTTPGGEFVYANGPVLAARCFVQAMSKKDKITAGISGTLLELEMAMLQILNRDLVRALGLAGVDPSFRFADQMRVVVESDDAEQVTYRVHGADRRSKGSISRVELTLVKD
jgi:hypothetical protein